MAVQFLGFGDGKDGDLVISSNTDYDGARASCNIAAGSRALSYSNETGSFEDGDWVMIIQSQYSTDPGNWELNQIESGEGTGTFTLVSPVQNSYVNTGTPNMAQIVELKRYRSILVQSGSTWSAPAWNGTTGGILAACCSGEAIVESGASISATGKGFRGGAVGSTDGNGKTGEGSRSGFQTAVADPDGNGGGVSNVRSAGGGHATSVSIGSAIGSEEGIATLVRLNMGGGGAAGISTNDDGDGGDGGGLLALFFKILRNSGTIQSDGTNGDNTSNGRPGAGGAGGSILAKCITAVLGTMRALAGLAGTGGGDPQATNGSVGRIRVEACTISGSSNPSASSQQGGHSWCIVGGGIY
jgi:hypothetical protein